MTPADEYERLMVQAINAARSLLVAIAISPSKGHPVEGDVEVAAQELRSAFAELDGA